MSKGATVLKNLLSNSRMNLLIAVMVSIAVVGAGYFVLQSSAAGFFAATEAEQNTPTGNAAIVDDATASGAKALQFNGPATPPPPQTGTCASGTHVIGSADPWGTCWPGPNNTGVPSGTTLSAYTGSCNVTTNNLVLDAKTINCNPMKIFASNVQITRSKINGSILIDTPNIGYSFVITDSEVDSGSIQGNNTNDDSGIGKSNFIATRVNLHGGFRNAWCEYTCTLQDSWVHDQAPDPSGQSHESGVRMGSGATPALGQIIRHNSLLCNAPDYPPDAGCSGDLSGYGDFAPIRNNLIEKNLFLASTGGACAYGGSSGDSGPNQKPFGKDASNITFKDNIFKRGSNRLCGSYFPNTDFLHSDETWPPGNVWTNNKWEDGAVVDPAS